MSKERENGYAFEEEDSDLFGEADFYSMYKEELDKIFPCDMEEHDTLLKGVLAGDENAKKRLIECHLKETAELAEEYRDKGLPVGDLVQEANMALILFVDEYSGGDFSSEAEKRIRKALAEALDWQDTEFKVEEEMAARVNVLNDISTSMAKELDREPTVEELAERMKMTVDEIKDIMRLTLDAMSVSGE